MKYLSLIIFLALSLSIDAQNVFTTDVIIGKDGAVSISTTMTSKDPEWSAISLAVKQGVKSKASSVVEINGNKGYVAYDKSSKKYILEYNGDIKLESTTVAAIRSQLQSLFYKTITGKTKT